MPICMVTNTRPMNCGHKKSKLAPCRTTSPRRYEILVEDWLTAGKTLYAFHTSAAAQISCALLKYLPGSGSDCRAFWECTNWTSFRWNWARRCPPENRIQEVIQLLIGIIMELLRRDKSQSKVIPLVPILGLTGMELTFFHSSPYGTVLCICG